MRAKNREINIFNMSLLDILTGALGAFMFMMLSFVPYYNIVMQQKLEPNPENKERPDKDILEQLKKKSGQTKELEEKVKRLEEENAELQKKVEELMKELERAAKGDASLDELLRLEEENRQLREKIRNLQIEIEQLTAKVEELRVENVWLNKEVSRLKAELIAAKAEIERLRRLLDKMRPGDGRQEAQNRVLEAELSARLVSVTVSAKVSDKGPFEFLIRDPKGVWYGPLSNFPLGKKGVRVVSRASLQLVDPYFNRHGGLEAQANLLYVDLDGFVLRGEYLIGVRRAGTYPKRPEATPAETPASGAAAGRGAEQAGNPFSFGFSLDLFLYPHPGMPPIRRLFTPTPTPSPGAAALSRFSLLDGLLRPENAVAQSLETNFGRGSSVSMESIFPPYTGSRVTIGGFVAIRVRERRDLELIPAQELIPDGRVAILARIRWSGLQSGNPIAFDWYEPQYPVVPGVAVDDQISLSDRLKVESRTNLQVVQALRDRSYCSSGVAVCPDDSAGDVMQAELDPEYVKLEEDKRTVAQPVAGGEATPVPSVTPVVPPPTAAPAATGQIDRQELRKKIEEERDKRSKLAHDHETM